MPEPISSATAAAALAKVAESAAEDIYGEAKSMARRAFDKLLTQFEVGFSKYIERTYDKCRFVKTILHRMDPVPIERAYVDPSLAIQSRKVRGYNFTRELDRLKNVVVTGSGGSGKSMFLKKTFLALCSNPLGRLPIFVELKDINDGTAQSILALIHSHWAALIPRFTLTQLDHAFRLGKFVVLLDALDEIDYEQRERYSKQILEMTFKYPNCRFLLTSRPDDRFSSWSEFYTASLLPMSKDQIVELVRKIDFDPQVKANFSKEISRRLLKSHQEFLSNPLLCTMMLMTYNEFEEIPSKMYIFYQRAFDVLFSRHDKTKTFFQRKFHTTLPEDDFRRLFSAFCFVSYLEGKTTFDAETAKSFVEAAAKLDRQDVSPGAFLLDLHQSVSILIKEGEMYSFVHRSFQEYFTAVFLAERQIGSADKLLARMAWRVPEDSTVSLLMEMNREIFETRYFIPLIQNMRKRIAECKGNASKILSLFYDEMQGPGGGSSFERLRFGEWYPVLTLVSQFYSNSQMLRRAAQYEDFLEEVFRKAKGVVRKEGDGKLVVFSKVPAGVIAKTSASVVVKEIINVLRDVDEQLCEKAEEKRDFISELLKQGVG